MDKREFVKIVQTPVEFKWSCMIDDYIPVDENDEPIEGAEPIEYAWIALEFKTDVFHWRHAIELPEDLPDTTPETIETAKWVLLNMLREVLSQSFKRHSERPKST